MVLLTTFACLRWGEVTALQRQDLDIIRSHSRGAVERATVTVRHALVEVRGQGLVLGPPKSRAGRRTITIPAAIVPAVLNHLALFVGEERDAFHFTGPTGARLLRGTFSKLVRWPTAVAELGVPGLHFHDLRHSGNTFAARTGASLRDLMARMGHDSSQAALIYQHATSEADQAIADAVSAQVEALKQTSEDEA
jgi:integrase